MPMIMIRYVTPDVRPDLPDAIAGLASELAASTLGKKTEVTVVLVEPAAPEHWFIGGKHPSDDKLSAFWLDIAITAGTNTKAETSAFVRSAFSGMRGLLGPLHETSYVHVQATDGEHYGYGGRTQNARWAEANGG